MKLEEFHSAANAIASKSIAELRERGIEIADDAGTSEIIAAVLPRCSLYNPGARVAAEAPARNDFDGILESFSAHITATMLTFAAKNLPARFDKVPGLPGGV